MRKAQLVCVDDPDNYAALSVPFETPEEADLEVAAFWDDVALIDKRMTRAACVTWLLAHGLEVPTKSACVFCPFQSRHEWRQVKDNDADWQKAVEVDQYIRSMRLTDSGGELYVHPDMKPLAEVDMRTAEEHGQLSLWENECYGLCGV